MILVCQRLGEHQSIEGGVAEQTGLSQENVAACKMQSLQDASGR